MLTFRNTFTVFFILIGIGNLLHIGYGIPIHGWYYLILTLLVLGVSSYGSSYIGSNFHFRVICRSKNNSKKQIAVSFDDGVDPVQTPILLDILAKHNMKASFFLIGKNCIGNESLVKRIFEEGHIIGNHTYSHTYWFDFYWKNRMYKEFKQTDQIIEKITGKRPFFFRPPYGVTNPALKKALIKSGHLPIGWSIRSFDTQQKNSASDLIHRVTTRLKAGDIILFHDYVKTVPEVLEALIKFGTENGYTFVTISELININAYVE
jgi:peptidoglycan-N-acetylglucosamine deacetylase